jgi:hypothetical protein
VQFPVTADEVPGTFTDERIRDMAKDVPLPADADLQQLAADARTAASDYAREARAPDTNEVHHEIADLENAAERKDYPRIAYLRANLSSQALAILKSRLDRPGPRRAGWWLPSAEDRRPVW